MSTPARAVATARRSGFLRRLGRLASASGSRGTRVPRFRQAEFRGETLRHAPNRRERPAVR